jgi:hypothetical protein
VVDSSGRLWFWGQDGTAGKQASATAMLASASHSSFCMFATLTGGNGYSIPAGAIVDFTDLWFFTPSGTTGQWTWVSGTQNKVSYAASLYGTFRTPSATTGPPSLDYPIAGIDKLNGIIYIYGGWFGNLDDTANPALWMYNIGTGQWTWAQGPNTYGSAALYTSGKGMSFGAYQAYPLGESRAGLYVDNSGSVFWGAGGYTSSENNYCNGQQQFEMRGLWGTFCVLLTQLRGCCCYSCSTMLPFTDLWYMPSPAPTVTLSLTIAAGATLISPLSAPIRVGTNLVTMGWRVGNLMDLTWNTKAADGVTTTISFTLRLTQVALSSSKSWNCVVTIPGVVGTQTLTDASPNPSTLTVPYDQAGSTVSMTFALAAGATIQPNGATRTAITGNRGSTTPVSFTVYAEDGSFNAAFVINFYVALSPVKTWSCTVSVPGLAVSSLTQASANPTSIGVPYNQAGSTATLAFVLGTATISPAGSPRNVVTGNRGSSTTASFSVYAEDGTTAGPFTIYFVVALSPLKLGVALSPFQDCLPPRSTRLHPIPL